MLSLAEDNEDADVIKHCVSTDSACSFTYAQVYKSLTENQNSFNISHALYPDGAKPSFLVKVNVYGPNKTHNSEPAKFTWSIHCLYANAPGPLLEMLSLGSILVTFREQELNIQIPAFCCNISDDDGERKKMIKGFLIRAQFEVSEYFEGIYYLLIGRILSALADPGGETEGSTPKTTFQIILQIKECK